MRLKLQIEPVPNSTWGVSLSNKLDKDEWAKIRQDCYRKADYKCEICGDGHTTLNAHEVWIFSDIKEIQRLHHLECCCGLCHDVHHFGRSTQVYPKHYVERLVRHWCKINKKTAEDFKIYYQEVFEINKKRANRQYIVKVGNRILC